jgi:hypothetical protein
MHMAVAPLLLQHHVGIRLRRAQRVGRVQQVLQQHACTTCHTACITHSSEVESRHDLLASDMFCAHTATVLSQITWMPVRTCGTVMEGRHPSSCTVTTRGHCLWQKANAVYMPCPTAPGTLDSIDPFLGQAHLIQNRQAHCAAGVYIGVEEPCVELALHSKTRLPENHDSGFEGLAYCGSSISRCCLIADMGLVGFFTLGGLAG